MRNRWVVSSTPVMSWCARLPVQRERELGGWQRLVVRAGDELAVYRVESVEGIGYDRVGHGPLVRFLDAHPERDPGVLLFDHGHRATARLAVADSGESIVERDVADLGDVLEAAPFEAPIRHRPPLRISVRAAEADDPWVGVSIASYSDIWLPWCSARFEPWAEPEDYVDNRELARRHTPRLNQFLALLREHTERIGGTWALDHAHLDRDLLFAFDEHGVDLAVDCPLLRVRDEPVLGEARDDVLAALRLGQRLISLAPPRPHFRVVVRASVLNPRHPLRTADRDQVLEALRHPLDPGARLTGDELRHVSTVEVQNAVDRYAYSIDEILG